ncbi:MAG: glycosyltransferase family 4 protein [Acidimicrobiia bacterium]
MTSNRRRGAEVFADRLREGLEGLGWRADLASLSGEPDHASVGATPVSRRTVGRLGRLNLDVVFGLRKHLRARHPEVVLANGSATLRYAALALATLPGGPVLAYASIGEPRYWARSRRQLLIQRMLLRRPEVVLAVSEATRVQLVDGLGVPADRVTLAHTGVPESFFSVPRRGPADALRLLFVGNLSPEKDPESSLEVLRRLRVPARLRLVGSGPLRAVLEERVRAAGLEDRVEMLGSVSDVRPHLAWADLLVLTSRTEGLPAAVLEAGAAGLPAVGFEVGGTGETIVDRRTGRLVPRGDLGGFCAAVESLAEDAALRTRMGAAARELVRERFTLDRSVQRYHEVLLAARRRSGSR